MNYLNRKNILLGITGGIAAYKAAELVRLFRKSGAVVKVVMTAAAKEFITPLTLQALSGEPVHDDLLDAKAEAAMGHIELARWADTIVIAPATANCIARLAQGRADDLLTTLCLASNAPRVIAPAMNQQMWQDQATQDNLKILQQRGIIQSGPASGEQACGDVGLGRMQEPQEIHQRVSDLFATGALAGQRVLITAGPTQEAIDPVRYISNHSSGKMGYALAQAALEAGAAVTLISGPVAITAPERVDLINILSANDMLTAVESHIDSQDIFISTAAVADYCCDVIAEEKIKKSADEVTLTLKRNPDILQKVSARANKPFCVGFAAETSKLVEHARAKLNKKNLDMIVANLVGQGKTFNSDDNEVTVITAADEVNLPRASKTKIARELITLIAMELKQ